MIACLTDRGCIMKRVHQNTKRVFVQGFKLLHNIYVDPNIFYQLQKTIENTRLKQGRCRIDLLQVSSQGKLQISREALQNFMPDSIQNIRKAIQNYLRASAELILQMIKVVQKTQSEFSLPVIQYYKLQQNTLENGQSLKIQNQQKRVTGNSLQDANNQQLSFQDIHLPTDESSGFQSIINQQTLPLPSEISNHTCSPHYNTAQRQSQSLFTENEIKRKNFALTQKQVAYLYADLKQPYINKKQIQQKYNISQSTVNRYMRRLKQKQQLPQYKEKKTFNSKYKSKQLPRSNNQSQTGKSPQTNQQFIRRKNSKVRLIEPKLIQIYSRHPQIYQSEAAQILSNFYKQQISIHVVSRCLKNIAKKKQMMQLMRHQQKDKIMQSNYQKFQQNSVHVQNRFQFAKEFIGRALNKVIYIGQGIYKKKPNEVHKTEKVHFALALADSGKIVHWKLKNHSFKPNQIANFVDQIWFKFQGYTLLLVNSQLHRSQPVRCVIKQKKVNHLYIPPYSPQLNPIQSIIPYFNAQFNNNLTENLDANQTLKLAHFTIMNLKQNIFAKETTSARYFVDVAHRKQPFHVKNQLTQTQQNIDG